MTKRRFILLALLVGVLAFLAAGCGGDDNEAAGTGGSTETGGASNVSGNISVLAVWTGAEGEAFKAVLDGFTTEEPGREGQLQVGEGAGDRALDVGRGRQSAGHRCVASAGLHD